jgi:uncharacterized protein YfaS (alpha-2-macroglobulin family)
MVTKEADGMEDARAVAYAIYLLSREGVITTNYIINLRDYLDKNFEKEWQTDLTSIYLAGALHLLHKEDDANKMITGYKIGVQDPGRWNDFYQPLGSDAQYIAVLAREFPARLKKVSPKEFERILQPIGDGQFNTLSAAYAVLALKSYSHAITPQLPELSIAEIGKDKKEKSLTKEKKHLQRVEFSANAAAIRFGSGGALGPLGAFYQVVEAGYDRKIPTKPLQAGLEVYRELLDKDNKPVTRVQLGEPITVRLRLRSVASETITNVALIDLLPGGFEVVGTSLEPGVSSIKGVDYVEVREDRAVFYADAPVELLDITYQIKATNRGEFTVPPVFAEAMYDRNVKAMGLGGKITVVESGK